MSTETLLDRDVGPDKKTRENVLKGKVAIVINDADGVGREIAEALVLEGVKGIIGTHPKKTREAGTRKVEKIKVTMGMNSWRISEPLNMADPEDRERLREVQNISFNGELDILILDDSGKTRENNNTGLNELAGELLPYMKNGGRIVLLKSYSERDGEQSLTALIPKLEEKGVSLIMVYLPEVDDISVSDSSVGQKVVELLKQRIDN